MKKINLTATFDGVGLEPETARKLNFCGSFFNRKSATKKARILYDTAKAAGLWLFVDNGLIMGGLPDGHLDFTVFVG